MYARKYSTLWGGVLRACLQGTGANTKQNKEMEYRQMHQFSVIVNFASAKRI